VISAGLVVVALVLGGDLYRRRDAWRYPITSGHLAPAFLLLVWIAGIELGQWTHSLVGTTAVGTTAIAAAWAVLLVRSPPRAPRGREPWTLLDRTAFVALAAAVFLIYSDDLNCHYSVTNTLLRGNVPPSALNDPHTPLVYHHLFDLVAAVFVNAFGVSVEMGLDLASVACLLVSICALQLLSRLLFKTAIAQQCSRLLFLFGMGPTYLGVLHPGGDDQPFRLESLHGSTVQSYAEAVFRRPMALAFVLFLYLFGLLAARGSADEAKAAPGRAEAWLLWLPPALVLPFASEELTIMATGVVIAACAFRWVRPVTALVWIVVVAAMLAQSSVFMAHFRSPPMTPHPVPVLQWPPTLPSWADAAVPVVSIAGLVVIAIEWGPLFLCGLAWPLWTRNRIGMWAVAFIALSFAPAMFCGLEGWPKSDLDRFLFYGTALGFMLSAGVIDAAASRLARRRHARWVVPVLATTWVAFAVSSPIAYLSNNVVARGEKPAERTRELQRALAMVGPRDLIRSDLSASRKLVVSGFVVDAPMPTNMIAQIPPDAFEQYMAVGPATAPDWWFLPLGDPRCADLPVVAEAMGYVLVRPPSRTR
jgi:hypothetical protein